jgi:hypothetical protein
MNSENALEPRISSRDTGLVTFATGDDALYMCYMDGRAAVRNWKKRPYVVNPYTPGSDPWKEFDRGVRDEMEAQKTTGAKP